jgi:AraC-like DNA-binding protein
VIHSVPAPGEPLGCTTWVAPVSAGLRDLVLGCSGFRSATGLGVRHRLLPLSAVVLVLDCGMPDGLVTGARDRPGREGPDRWGCGLTVGLTPRGVRELLGVPMSELTGRTVGLSELVGTRGGELTERLAAARAGAVRPGEQSKEGRAVVRSGEQSKEGRAVVRSGEQSKGARPVVRPGEQSKDVRDRWEQVAVLDSVLGGWAASARRQAHAGARPAVDEAWRQIHRGGAMTVAALSRRLGVGRRGLERGFRDEFGLPPGSVGRIVRFQRAVGLLAGGADLAVAAAESGFADQPHLNRETRALAGTTPGELRAIFQYARAGAA